MFNFWATVTLSVSTRESIGAVIFRLPSVNKTMYNSKNINFEFNTTTTCRISSLASFFGGGGRGGGLLEGLGLLH